MISDAKRSPWTVPRVSVVGDRGGARAAALGFRLEWTPCRFGGARPWLVCPRCGSRRTSLYGPYLNAVADLKCRLCLRIPYPSRSASWCGRRVLAALRIRERLGGKPDLEAPFPRRQRGMRRATYARLAARGRLLERIVRRADELREDRAFFRGRPSMFSTAALLRNGRSLVRADLAELRALKVSSRPRNGQQATGAAKRSR